MAFRGSSGWHLLGAVFLLAASLALVAYGLRDELFLLVLWVGEMIGERPVLGAVIFFIASACSVLFLFLSSVLLVPVAIVAWGHWLTFFLLASGWLFGWIVAYFIGRFFRDQAFVETRLSQRGFATALLSGKLPFSLVLIVVCSLPAEIVGYALGVTRYPFRSFLVALALVEIPFAFLIVFIGESFLGDNVDLFIGLLLLLVGIYIWEVRSARRMRRRA